MSTTVLARPAQALRRRETGRPSSLPTKRGLSLDTSSDGPSKKRRLAEPYVRDSQYILRKHKGKAPSFTIHLYTNHFKFDGQDTPLAYDGPMRSVIKHLRTQTVPHELLEELLMSNVPFYDGCLIVEVHNHRELESRRSGGDTKRKVDDSMKQSMHAWNAHITPSPYAPYPVGAQFEADGKSEAAKAEDRQDSKQGDVEGPKITTIVLQPTEQTKHEELLILAKTPAHELAKRKSGDATTPLSNVPPTPSGAGPRPGASGQQKMALCQDDLYSFHGDLLLTTEPPLYLEPASTPYEADAIMKMLEHPLHSGKPPAAKGRKRTTAEMAADDAQAAEAERRMLIFDERLGSAARTGAGASTGDNSATAAALGFSRFKTIEMVRQRHAEQEQQNKEEEARLAQEKQQQEAQMNAQQQQRQLQQKKQELQYQEQRRRVMMQQAEALNKMNGQAQANSLMHNGANFPNAAQSQASPVVNQQTPLMPHSSPMVTQNGFPMMPTVSSAGSPPRPPSAAIPNSAGMTRGPSQQTLTSMVGTPLMNQNGTPSLANAVPNRAMSQTPRLGPSSPMTGTPAGNMMQTPRLNGNLSTTQDIMIQQMQNSQAQNMMGMPAGLNNNAQNGQPSANINPESVQFARRMARYSDIAKQFQGQAAAATAQGNTGLAAQFAQRAQHAQQSYNAMRSKLLAGGAMVMQGQQQRAVQNGQMQMNAAMMNSMQNGHMGQAGMNQQQQQQQTQNNAMLLAQQQQQQQLQRQRMAAQSQQLQLATQQLNTIASQHGGQIPPHVITTLPPHLQQVIQQRRIHAARQAAQQQQQLQQQQAGHQMNAQNGMQNGAANYMQNLQALGMQTLQSGQQGGVNMNAMMNMNLQQQLRQQQLRQQHAQAAAAAAQAQQNGSTDLSQSFADMQAALQQSHQ